MTHLRFLIVRLSSIGDVLHCTPVPRALKMAFPNCHITWLVDEAPSILLKSNPYIDEIYIWPRERFEQHLRKREFSAAWELYKRLRQDLHAKTFDITLDIHGLFLSGMIAATSNAARIIGMGNTRELNWLFMNETSPSSLQDTHVIQRYLSILKPLGITTSDYTMTLHLSEEDMAFANHFLIDHSVKPKDTIIAINPATTWPAKNWPKEYYATAAKALQHHGHIMLCGGPGDRALADDIIQQSSVPIINAVGQTTLMQLAALLSRCTMLLTGDTGPLHMAIALGIPTVSIFGPTSPQKFGPLTPGHVVLQEQLPCIPCHKKLCPLHHLNCMYFLSPDKVITAVQTLLTQIITKKNIFSIKGFTNKKKNFI